MKALVLLVVVVVTVSGCEGSREERARHRLKQEFVACDPIRNVADRLACYGAATRRYSEAMK